MTKELSEALKRLETISPKLNTATDTASEVVRLVESFLNEKCSLGIRAWVTVTLRADAEDDPQGQQDKILVESSRILLYDRPQGDSFRICLQDVEYGSEGDGGPPVIFKGKPVPWAEAGRFDKLESFAYLPELLEDIANEAEKMLKGAEKATVTSKQIMEVMAEPKKQ